ncbi:ATP-dependent DNA helicase RecG [Natronospirillum operosum]|uniref:ATP-dependent DNA helicase RecG n=1 Tax=Natronospirillum operosum TaxID=2759953 RepID=A0A4Z0WCK5_9GAMM|nr:ATP-dependent DNA helicase RecG [Natronospirillum operosum]TGG91543.1 ATP-dependent DNA helicase RecG [Natronospirillum operosum]
MDTEVDPALTRLKGVGAQLAEKLERLHLRQIPDLLFHLPLRYEDRTRIHPLGQLRLGQHALIRGRVVNTSVQYGRRRSLLVRVRDDSGEVGLRFYYFSAAQQRQLQPGTAIQAFGEARRGATGLEFYHPEYSAADDDGALPAPSGTLTPVYPTTEGLTQKRLRQLMEQALAWMRTSDELPDLLPASLREQWQLPALPTALDFIHNPPPATDLETLISGDHPCVARLAVEELLAQHLGLRQLRHQARAEAAPPLHSQGGTLQQQLRASLPFALTAAQDRVLEEIEADLARPVPMLRLVQGDVGAGKTLVAVLAMLRAVDAGWQSVFMAPTEILAEQHARNLTAWLQSLGIEVVLLLGRQTRRQRTEALARIAAGAACVVGTHALFQEEVRYQRLGLVVVDEQHRFGVDQRLLLREKGRQQGLVPHQLIMTATPIPRTLAMSMYADLDFSVIDELPPGRTPVVTTVMNDAQRERVIQRVRDACTDRRQVYWVCTLIEDSDELQAQAAEELYTQLTEALQPFRVALVHGRMKNSEKSAVMSAFKAGETQVLVATTVIEVGVDVPNASVMIIENAERLGLSQLHQLRGRVGRGAADSYCVLLYRPPLSQGGKARLNTMRSTSDGFQIAEQDLLLRGPGEVLGTRQTGEAGFRIANLQRDQHWLPAVKQLSETLEREYPDMATALLARWHPEGLNYGKV